MKLTTAINTLAACIVAASASATVPVVIENDELSLTISPDGLVQSLLHKPSGSELVVEEAHVPACVITQYRPYDNENFLMFPAKPRSFPSNKAWMQGDTLMLEFADTYDIAKVKVTNTPAYIAFELVDRDYRIEDFGIKRKTELDEFTILQIPVKPLPNFGEWLNVVWDDSVAVALMGTQPETFIDSYRDRDNFTLKGQAHTGVKLMNTGVALIVTRSDSLLNHIDRLEADYDMPRGVRSRLSDDYRQSYYELREFSPANIDRNIMYALQGGFKNVMIYYRDFARACGHFQYNDSLPRGLDDLRDITRKIHEAGMNAGIHIHYSKVEIDDPYINSGNPDGRINVVSRFTLASDIQPDDSVIYIKEYPSPLRHEEGRRLLMIDSELVMFDSISTTRPYAFIGCERGVYNSASLMHPAGTEARHIDVDDWPIFLRIDQRSDIQGEIAGRLAEMYDTCGFNAVYFDGAEDVPMPYWYNVSRSQLEVYNSLGKTPVWCEGAQKSHYGWHILSRGNAFDVFRPERLRQGMKKYTLRCARQVACDFSSVNFGWFNYVAPDSTTIGIQPDMVDFAWSKALAWDAPLSLVANLPEIERHPRTADNFRAMRLWEEAKLNNAVPDSLKIAMRDPEREWTIDSVPGNPYQIHEVCQVTSDEFNATVSVRAFIDLDASNDRETVFIIWSIDRPGYMVYNDTNDKIPIDGRRRLLIPLGPEAAVDILLNLAKTFTPY